MAAPLHADPQPESFLHKRTPSAVLRSIVTSRASKTETTATAPPSPTKTNDKRYARAVAKGLPPLPLSTSDLSRPLGEINNLQHRSPYKERPKSVYGEPKTDLKSLNMMTKSAISLKALTGKDKERTIKEKAVARDGKPKKSKSSTSLSALLMRPKSSKGVKQDDEGKDKENHLSPDSSKPAAAPIWAQFATPKLEEVAHTTKVPLNDSWTMNDEVALYTPQEYSPAKGRNFGNYQPTLGKKPQLKQRPVSAFVIAPVQSSLPSFPKMSRLSGIEQETKGDKIATTQDQPRNLFMHRTGCEGMSNDRKGRAGNQGSRVMTAVAAFSGKGQSHVALRDSTSEEAKLDPVTIQAAFEAVLESRNIAPDVREKMRGLDTNMKAEFVKQQNKTASPNGSENGSRSLSRPATAKTAIAENESIEEIPPGKANIAAAPIKSRPRSLTFTLSKRDVSPQKKQKSGKNSHNRNKSADLPRSASSKSLNAPVDSPTLSYLGRAQKYATPEDYILHLRKAQRPQLVEVGRLQKLRQLLRNETVSWVEEFVAKGGMAEMVGLLYRIINIEWREEQDDALLHHTLNCLKALLTTASALEYLSTIQDVLFPTLINLLFSSGEAKRGPSEFTTRTLIISLLFSYLQSAPTPAPEERAKTILSYLRDPTPAESDRPPGWIVEMHRPRPYKLWETEIFNVTKEVFWIFLHHVNIIPFPSLLDDPNARYLATHFPVPRAPVPAAPHVGGVEWDATTYLATHIDLLNGIIASLPSRDERCALRVELRDSGFEKVMSSMRTCKEKFYGAVHEALSTWVGAAQEDGWSYRDVKEGMPREEYRSKSRSPAKKKKGDEPPVLGDVKIDIGGSKLDLGPVGLMGDDWI